MCFATKLNTGNRGKPPVKMKVIITKEAKQWIYEDLEPTMTILDLKKFLHEREGILYTAINLFIHFIEVDDNMLLHHYAQGLDTLKISMILQKRGTWTPETFFVKKHEGELTSFVIHSRQSLKVKSGIFKITQAITKDEKRICEVYTYKIDSESKVDFIKAGGNYANNTNIRHPPKTVVSIEGEEIDPIKKEEFSLRSNSENLDEKLSFNYNLLTTVTDVPFPPKIPATSEEPGAISTMGEPEWVILKNVEINEETLPILLSGQPQMPTLKSPIRRRSDPFTFPEEKDAVNPYTMKPVGNKRKQNNEGKIKKSKNTRSVGEGIMAEAKAKLIKWIKIIMRFMMICCCCQQSETKNEDNIFIV